MPPFMVCVAAIKYWMLKDKTPTIMAAATPAF
jgi:hypothetical protein